MPMVGIGVMRMLVDHRLVRMRVDMRRARGRVRMMRVPVMLVVNMKVLVLQRFMSVAMRVAFR